MAVRRRPAREAPGQHFLRARQLAADIVAEAGVASGDRVLDLGGGTGVLTQALAASGARVVAVERDSRLAALLRARFSERPAVTIVEADAAEYSWPSEEFAVVANLPFARSGAILARLLRDPRTPLRKAHVIVQWELASKHAAVWPATLRSTYWRAWYDVSIVRCIDRTAFAPPPRVTSALLRFERRPEPAVAPELHEAYWRLLSAAFAARAPIRRCLQPWLSPLQVKRLARTLGFAPDAPAWDLDATQWARLFAAARRSA